MKYLLDTHILLWATTNHPKLSSIAKEIILDESNELYFSTASIWEIAIKVNLGKLHLPVNTPIFRRTLLENNYLELEINSYHAMATEQLPLLHQDPFDRILLAQAQHEGFFLLSADSKVQAYGEWIVRA